MTGTMCDSPGTETQRLKLFKHIIDKENNYKFICIQKTEKHQERNNQSAFSQIMNKAEIKEQKAFLVPRCVNYRLNTLGEHRRICSLFSLVSTSLKQLYS